MTIIPKTILGKPTKRKVVLETFALVMALFLAGCSETSSSAPQATGRPQSALGDGRNKVAPSADVKKIDAWRDATMLASRGQGREALVGGGESMNPVYGDNTMLVVHPIAFEDLKAGMTVVYMNREGRRVAHQLVRREGKGWRAQGLNNPGADYEYVTPQNLIGVVYASLSSELPDEP